MDPDQNITQRQIPPMPERAVDMLNGRVAADDIRASMLLAFWMVGRDGGAAGFHYRNIHAAFAELADELGYTIALKPVAESSPAEVA